MRYSVAVCAHVRTSVWLLVSDSCAFCCLSRYTMSADVRYERDIYTWLTALELSQYYFMFKAAGMEKIRVRVAMPCARGLVALTKPSLWQDILYLEASDLARVGVEDPAHVRKLMVGVRHVVVPDKISADNRCSSVFQSGRLVVDIFSFLDYTTLILHTRVCRFWRECLNKGVRKMTITNPVALHAPVTHVVCQFSSLTHLNGALMNTVVCSRDWIPSSHGGTCAQRTNLAPRARVAWPRASSR